MFIFYSFTIFLFFLDFVHSVKVEDGLVIVIINSVGNYNLEKSQNLKQNIINQYKENEKLLNPNVLILTEDFKDTLGSWTVLPIIKNLVPLSNKAVGVLFVDEHVTISLKILTTKLKSLNLEKEIFGGKVLTHRTPTIIHHYNIKNPPSFPFPHPSSGFFLSSPLLNKVNKQLKQTKPPLDFSIDAYFELSQYIVNSSGGPEMENWRFFCGHTHQNLFSQCAVYIVDRNISCSTHKTESENIFVAVKTCQKFHTKRIPLLKETWASEVKNLVYYSDVEDSSIPTVAIGVPNTEMGHCEKLMRILKKMRVKMEEDENLKWAMVFDDDSLVSISRLLGLLSCYDSKEKLFIGEKYGYNVVSGLGYNYITLGGGMAVSREGLKALVDSNKCRCSRPDFPDDMIIGMCLQSLGIPISNSFLFHQARPYDYSDDLLADHQAISFHRFTDINPLYIYKKYLVDDPQRKEEENDEDFYYDEEETNETDKINKKLEL